MSVYHFSASGYRQGANEFCADDAAAEKVAFEMFLELSACAERVVVVTVRNAAGDEVLKVPRLPEPDIIALRP
jgi:hypothetical protein